VLITFAANAQADFSAGLDAYTKKDYRTAMEEFKPLAEQGNADAQFMLGYMYASGKGVLQDYIQAHVWFNLSAAQGVEKAAASRDRTAQVMTPQQIAEAQKIAREWRPIEVQDKQPPKGTQAADTVGPTETELIQRIQENLGHLSYVGGQTPKFQLMRQSYRGPSIIETSKSVPILNDGQAHVIKWQRYSDGNMIVAVDGEVIISSIDQTFQDSFDGISIANHNGNYAVSFIDVYGE
jgi:hypothetical protein